MFDLARDLKAGRERFRRGGAPRPASSKTFSGALKGIVKHFLSVFHCLFVRLRRFFDAFFLRLTYSVEVMVGEDLGLGLIVNVGGSHATVAYVRPYGLLDRWNHRRRALSISSCIA